jgi:hypothetical protein
LCRYHSSPFLTKHVRRRMCDAVLHRLWLILYLVYIATQRDTSFHCSCKQAFNLSVILWNRVNRTFCHFVEQCKQALCHFVSRTV